MEKAQKTDAARTFAEHVVKTRFSDIPRAAVDVTKKDILDTLGCALAGSSAPGTPELLGLMEEWGGKKESTIWVFGQKMPAANAALVNGSMAHARDFDDTYDLGLVHVGVSTVPAAFAVAERLGKVSGKDLVTACALGQDMILRMVGAVTLWNDFHATGIHGVFGATATAAKLLRLDQEKMLHAFGIGYCQASGNSQAIHDGALTKRFQAGHAARGGVLAALLAQRGFTGATKSLEGQSGFFPVYYGGNYNREVMLADLGKTFEGVRLGFKPYPSARCNHSSIDAAIFLSREYDLKPEKIAAIELGVNPRAYKLCVPEEIKHHPKTIVDAQFSVPYNVVTAIIDRKVQMSHFSENSILRRDVLALLQKVKSHIDPEIEKTSPLKAATFGRVKIRTKDGKEYVKQIDVPKGHSQNPMSDEELADKFRDCAANAARPISDRNVEKALDLLLNLERVDDVGQVVRLLSPRGTRKSSG